MSDKTLHTVSKQIDGYTVKATQAVGQFDFGHYRWYIEDPEEHIVKASYTVGAPPNKISESTLDDLFDEWRHYERQ